MDVAVLLFFAGVLAVVVWFVAEPLRRPEGAADEREDPRVAELEARKEAKYREIRDAELDRAAGKLTDADWRRQDAELRAEAVEILDQLDRVRERAEGSRPGA